LGFLVAVALSYYSRNVRRAYGPVTALFYTFLQLSQFHLPYYASRTLPNTFALLVSIIAHACFLPIPASSARTQQNQYKLGIYLLSFAAVVFRAELALLLGFQSLYLLLSKRMTLRQIIVAVLVSSVIGFVATTSVDSCFWQPYRRNPIFTTPFLTEKLGLIWPEFSAFYFNAIQGNASAWGESPWHYYFTSAIPKQLMNPIWVVTIPVAIIASPRSAGGLLFPGIGFVAVYSLIAHKEWRFVMYVVPQFTLLSSIGAAWIWNRRSKNARFFLPGMVLLASIPVCFIASTAMLAVSTLNYPGGAAISRVYSYIPTPSNQSIKIHLDVTTCMTGATRFLQESPMWSSSKSNNSRIQWDKTEDESVIQTASYWQGIDFAIIDRPEKAIGKYDVLESISGFRRVRVYKPGEKVAKMRMATEGGKASWSLSVLESARFNGFGAREWIFRGWWVGIEIEEMIWIVKKSDGED
jgi:hypothetical protein